MLTRERISHQALCQLLDTAAALISLRLLFYIDIFVFLGGIISSPASLCLCGCWRFLLFRFISSSAWSHVVYGGRRNC